VSKIHKCPETECFGCKKPIQPEKARNGSYLVRCAECRQAVRMYQHQKMRKTARRARDEGWKLWPWMERMMNHECSRDKC